MIGLVGYARITNIALQKLEGYIKRINEEAKIKVRFVFINSKDINAGKTKYLGTYGVISGASSFIVGILNKDEKDALEF